MTTNNDRIIEAAQQETIDKLQNILFAIRARINGEWDHPALVALECLSGNLTDDILNMIAKAES